VFRDEAQLPEQLVFYEDYLGERDATFTLNFSGSSALILAQYYNFIRYGHAGYASLVRAMQANATNLAGRLADEDALEPLGTGPRLPLVVSRVRDEETFTATDLVGELGQRRGWMVPAYRLPPANDDQHIMRMLVKINQTRELADALADDVHESIADLRKRAAGEHPRKRVHRGHDY
jgi:glutamate decarboxylase